MTPEPQGLATAPRDGTMVWLLVDYEGGDHALVDASRAWTIGHNNFDNDGQDVWQFAGWCWAHDHYTQGEGTVLAWSPIGFGLEGSDGSCAACGACPGFIGAECEADCDHARANEASRKALEAGR